MAIKNRMKCVECCVILGPSKREFHQTMEAIRMKESIADVVLYLNMPRSTTELRTIPN